MIATAAIMANPTSAISSNPLRAASNNGRCHGRRNWLIIRFQIIIEAVGARAESKDIRYPADLLLIEFIFT